MKTILRNFLSTLRRYKLASGLNILGLSVAFAAFVVILMQVNYERSFDKSYPEQVYRVETGDQSGHYSWFSRPASEVLGEGSSSIESWTFNQPYSSTTYLTVEQNGSRVGYNEYFESVSSGEGDVFGYDLVEGSPTAFQDYTKVILPQSVARKIFGDHSAVGQVLTFENEVDTSGRKKTCEVGAVYRDFAANTSMRNNIKRPFDPWDNKNQWGNSNYCLYVTLYPGATPSAAARQMTDAYKQSQKPEWAEQEKQIFLQPLEAVYYDMTTTQDIAPKGSRATMNLLLAIALLVIGIAAVNFVNFSTSLTPLRIKSINTQKVLGSPVSTLRTALVGESVGISLIAFGLALVWVWMLSDTGFNSLISGGISFSVYRGVILLGLGVALGVGLLAGLYPAVYTTSFPPALVLKGSFGMSPKGRKLRTALIGFQFVVSIGLIISALFLQLQNRYMRGMDTGFHKDNIALVKLSKELADPTKTSALVAQLKSDASIEDVAFSAMTIGTSDQYMHWGRKTREGADVDFECFPVSWNFCRVMGIQMVEGRDFTQEDELREGTFIFNQIAMTRFGLTLDDQVQGHRDGPVPIVGVVRDFNYASLRNNIAPMCLYQFGANPWGHLDVAYIKVKGDPFAAAEHIRSVLKELDPLYPADIVFYDTAFNTLYQKERKTTSLITIFSLLAVVISLVGVFGLVVFETQYRRKEIGVRKVMGATVAEILAMFNRSFVKLVIVCFVVGAPLAWYGVTRWLESFAYRTPIYWWVFGLSLLVVLLITLITVTIQSWRAATANPVGSLKAE